jgi:hypothetical protein
MEEIALGILDFGTGIMLGAFIFGILGFIGAKISDPYFRVKIMNSVMKQNWLLLKIVSKDGKTIRSKAVNAETGTVSVGTKVWVVADGRIYREKKESEGFFTKESKKILYEEGVPTIYVNEDSIKPLNFEGDKTSTLKPQEIGAILNSWISNQLAKGLLAMKQQNWLMYGVLILLVVNIYFSFDNNERLDAMEAKLGGKQTSNNAQDDTKLPEGGTLEDDKIVIRQGDS